MTGVSHFTSLVVFAAAADWVEIIIPVVVFLIWIINQIASLGRGAKDAPPKPQRPAAPNAGDRGAAQNAPGQRGLMDEVEAFLRDARKAMEEKTDPRQQQANRPQQQQPPRPPAVAPAGQRKGQAKQKPQRGGKTPPPPPPRQGGRVPLADQLKLKSRLERSTEGAPRSGSIEEHVKQHFAGGLFDERAGRLSHLQQSAESELAGHVHDAFDDQSGRQKAQTGTRIDAEGAAMTTDDSATGPNSVVQIVAMLRDPQSMRNAIILQEILSPPTHRW